MTSRLRARRMGTMPDPCAAYLASLDAALRGPRGLRRSLVREAGDHLEDAVEANVERGLDVQEATALALADFGTVEEVAPAFQTTLAVASARRTALLFLTVMLVQPFVWDQHGEVAPDSLLYAVLDTGVEFLGMLMMAIALVSALACGIGNRWLPAGRTIARATGWAALVSGGALVAVGTTMVVLTDRLVPGQWTLLTIFVLVPIAATSVSARRTLALSTARAR